MSGQQQLSSCRVALQESWANFPVKQYDRVLVFVALLTPKQEILLTEDGDGNWGLPHERFAMRDMLLRVPERVVNRSVGLDPRQQLAADSSKIKLLGACEIGRDYCVVLSMPIAHQVRHPKCRYVAGAALQPYAEQQQIITPVAHHFGWAFEKAAA